jgi:hydroxypyruvate reductase
MVPEESLAAVRRLVLEALLAGIRAVDAERAVARHVSLCSQAGEPLVLIAVGKAAYPMAAGAIRVLGRRIRRGLVVTKDGHLPCGASLPGLELAEAAHPVPDRRSLAAGRRCLELAARLTPAERLLVLVSGGASSLVEVPPAGVPLEALAEVHRRLLASGAVIGEINTVRRHLSRIKGGGLARAAGGRVATLYVSDVPGDDPAVIGSGLTAADRSTFAQALRILARRSILAGKRGAEGRIAAALEHLRAGAAGRVPETLDPADPIATSGRHAVVGGLEAAIDAACAAARAAGAHVVRFPGRIEGEARRAGARLLARLVRARSRPPAGAPLVVLGGGETVVRVAGPGRGGRNQEVAVGAIRALARHGGAVVVALGTDGTDGTTDAAGAIADSSSLARARALGLAPEAALAANDCYPFLSALGDLVVTGPTGTNVGDLHAAAIAAIG